MSIPVVDPAAYPQLFAAKAEQIQSQFAALNPPALARFDSPPSHYRMRCEFRVWHEGDDLFYVMFEIGEDPKKDRRLVRMDNYPVASERINQLMPALLAAIKDWPLLRQRLFQVEFLTTLSGEALVTLIYHKPLTDEWETAARQLQAQLGVSLIGRSRKQKRVLDRDHVWETLEVEGRQLHYQQIEGSFTQPNARVGEKMLNWALSVTRPAAEPTRDLVELYCGNGNFTLALAPHFRRVLGTEISRTSVAAARVNIERNQVDNVRVERLSAEEFALALADPQHPKALAYDLPGYDFSTLLVDPPRAGLDDATREQARAFERIVYISCNPDTLLRDLTALSDTHQIEQLAFFDQFPYTHHAECGAYLVQRGKASQTQG